MTIKGVDPHDQIPEALARGAVGFFHERGKFVPSNAWARGRSIEVADLRQMLFHAAEAWREKLDATTIIALTGSNGKTTVKEMLASILRARGSAAWTHANLNTKIGIASRILQLQPHVSRAVFEVGARRVGDFEIPLAMLKPSIVGCLNIGEAHVGEFGGTENLIRTKLSIYPHAPDRALTACVANADDHRILRAALATGAPVFAFATRQGLGANFGLGSVNRVAGLVELAAVQMDLSRALTMVRLRIEGIDHDFEVPGCQRTHGLNAAAAVTFAIASGINDLGVIARGLNGFASPPRRFEFLSQGPRYVIDDSFNSSPSSLRESLLTLRELFPRQTKVLILGSMLELGAESAALHHECGEFVGRELQPDLLITVGEEAGLLGAGAMKAGLPTQSVIRFSSTANLVSHLTIAADRGTGAQIAQLRTSDVVFFKGSRAMALNEAAQALMLCEE